MAKGKIKNWLSDRDFGFIQSPDVKGDAFVHVSDLKGDLKYIVSKGMEVEFDAEKGPRGWKAKNVRAAQGDADRAGTVKDQGGPAPRRGQDDGEYRFLNPYNFVRFIDADRPRHVLGDAPPPPHDRFVGISGKISCELTAVTPLFTADSHGSQNEGSKSSPHKHLRFLKAGGEEIVSGTGLKGMVRNVFEAVTNSCMGVFDDKRRLSYRLNPGEALGLVPARVERHGKDAWSLVPLPGTTRLQSKGFRGTQYAAWARCYDPMLRSRTMWDAPSSPYSRRDKMIDKIRVLGLNHGDECWALLEEIGHPKRKALIFWNVADISSDRNDLRNAGGGRMAMKGYLCITNQNIDNKHDERFFFRDPSNKEAGPTSLPLGESVRKDYNILLEDYHDRHRDDVGKRGASAPFPAGKGNPGYSRFIIDKEKLSHGDLVYAKIEGSYTDARVSFIAPVSIPRLAYQNAIGDLLPGSKGHFHACKADSDGKIGVLCPACRTFGWVDVLSEDSSKNKQREDQVAYKGRVRFTHGRLEDKKPFQDDGVPLAILSTPKPTTSRFYLADPEGKASSGREDRDAGYDGPVAGGKKNRLRGRKFYRHQPVPTQQEYVRAGRKKDDQNRSVQGVMGPGSRFRFEVFFENLALEELGALLWSIELDPACCHRLGMARPLGFGSVKVKVESIVRFDPKTRYAIDWDKTGVVEITDRKDKIVDGFKSAMSELYSKPFDSLPPVLDLRALLSEDQPGLPVHYPRSTIKPTLDGKNFEWFMGNKRSGKDHGPRHGLPLATDDKKGFPLLDRLGKVVKK